MINTHVMIQIFYKEIKVEDHNDIILLNFELVANHQIRFSWDKGLDITVKMNIFFDINRF